MLICGATLANGSGTYDGTRAGQSLVKSADCSGVIHPGEDCAEADRGPGAAKPDGMELPSGSTPSTTSRASTIDRPRPSRSP